MPRRVKSAQKVRLEIAAIAAKLVAVEGVSDYHAAKRKAALQLGLPPGNNLPANREVEQALVDYQNLFHADTQTAQLRNLRLQALKAMKLLVDFRPVLVGPVANGTATSSSDITLHLFFDHVEELGLFLTRQGIPSKVCEKTVRINARQSIICPAFRFFAGQTAIVLVIFSDKSRNHNPLSSIDNKPLRMTSVKELEQMIDESNPPEQY